MKKVAMQTLSVTACEGPSFPVASKWLATTLVAGLLVWTARVADALTHAELGWGGIAFLAAVFVVIGASYWAMLSSRTSVDGTHIRQTWLWTKQVAIADITQIKLIHVPLLSWLIAPRMVVRAKGLGLFTFHAAGPDVLRVFGLLAHGVAPQASQ